MRYAAHHIIKSIGRAYALCWAPSLVQSNGGVYVQFYTSEKRDRVEGAGGLAPM